MFLMGLKTFVFVFHVINEKKNAYYSRMIKNNL